MPAIFPFTAIVGQERMKRALILNAVDTRIGGVLIRGARGTGKYTADRVVATLDIEKAIQKGERHFEPGVLAGANRGLLYIDEVNLLDDHVVDILLDSAAMGVDMVERAGISFPHPD